jgi:hypothetical protein
MAYVVKFFVSESASLQKKYLDFLCAQKSPFCLLAKQLKLPNAEDSLVFKFELTTVMGKILSVEQKLNISDSVAAFKGLNELSRYEFLQSWVIKKEVRAAWLARNNIQAARQPANTSSTSKTDKNYENFKLRYELK